MITLVRFSIFCTFSYAFLVRLTHTIRCLNSFLMAFHSYSTPKQKLKLQLNQKRVFRFGGSDEAAVSAAVAAEKVTELVPPNSNQHSYEQLPCSKFNYSYKAIYTVFTWRQLVQAVNNSAALPPLLLLLLLMAAVVVCAALKLYSHLFNAAWRVELGEPTVFSFTCCCCRSFFNIKMIEEKSQTMIARALRAEQKIHVKIDETQKWIKPVLMASQMSNWMILCLASQRHPVKANAQNDRYHHPYSLHSIAKLMHELPFQWILFMVRPTPAKTPHCNNNVKNPVENITLIEKADVSHTNKEQLTV